MKTEKSASFGSKQPQKSFSVPAATSGRRKPLLSTLRGRLLLSFVGLALISVASLAYFLNLNTSRALNAASNQALKTAAEVTARQIEGFLRDTQYALEAEAELPEFGAYFNLPNDQRKGSPEEQEVRAVLSALYNNQKAREGLITGYWLFDIEGRPIASSVTNDFSGIKPFNEMDKADSSSFNLLLTTGYPYISPIIVDANGRSGSISFASRIEQTQGQSGQSQAAAVLIAQYDANVLQQLADDNALLAGTGSFAVLFDENHIRLAQSNRPDLLYKTIVPLPANLVAQLQAVKRLPTDPTWQDLSTKLNSLDEAAGKTLASRETEQYDLYFMAQALPDSNEIYRGAGKSLGNRTWGVLYMQPQSLFMEPLRNQNLIAMSSAILISLIALILGIIITRQLTQPITLLTGVAEKVTAGNLWAQAPEGNDEIGSLGRVFNAMTSELRSVLEDLEHRVAERTSELARVSEKTKERANQLQTVAEVAHTIASLQDPEELLNTVAEMISERFAFYHVGIFLIDKNGEYAVLQAANSEGGKRMLARSHRLEVGQVGIVGYVTGRGQPRIALDVGRDAVFFDNPDLPYTRSEMAVPLRVGNRIIGALDVQSMEQSAFDEDDIALLSTLADQVAVAIENTRLFAETRSALSELQTMHRQFMQQEWTQVVSETRRSGYQYKDGRMAPVSAAEASGQAWTVAEGDRATVVVTSEDGGSNSIELLVPINVRGELIGMLNLGTPQGSTGWSQEEISLVQAVADQIGQALENARLLEQTQRRAVREHLVAEITTKLRASNDPQAILHTAAQELRAALRASQARFVVQPQAPPVASEPAPGENGHDHETDLPEESQPE